MALTDRQVYDLNNMNRAAQNVKLGDLLKEGEAGESSVSNATTSTAGIVKQAEAQADSVATDAENLKTDFNSLLAKLRSAGIMAE